MAAYSSLTQAAFVYIMAPQFLKEDRSMRSVTEFPVHKLTDGFKTKTALAAEGKTPEEIQTALGEKYKYEGDKLKHFLNAMEVANANLERFYSVLIVSFADGEAAPAIAVKIEEHHYK